MVFRTANTLNITYASGNQGYYGSFYSSLDQSDGVNTPTLLYAENTADAAGITMELGTSGKKSRMTFAYAGTYNIQFSAQLHNTGGGGSGSTINIWFRLNGSDIANSDTKVTVPSNAPYVVAAWNFIVSVTAGQYVEMVFKTDNANILFEQENATADTPAVPSIILTAVQVR
jgi:hypothetical protein